jgi:hypothetical protein
MAGFLKKKNRGFHKEQKPEASGHSVSKLCKQKRRSRVGADRAKASVVRSQSGAITSGSTRPKGAGFLGCLRALSKLFWVVKVRCGQSLWRVSRALLL